MLILTRREGSKVIIGNCISVSVIESSDGRVKLGIDAPEGISVHRNEIYQRILDEGRIDEPKVNIDDFKPNRKQRRPSDKYSGEANGNR